MHRTAVVILSFNGKKWLDKFLPNVLSNSKDDADIIVIDNGSSDDSVNFIHTTYKEDIKVIQLKKNWGFTGGYNKGLKDLNYDYFILLNSDVEVTPNWIKPIINQFEKDSSIAAVQPKIMSHSQKTTFEYAGACGGFIDKFGYPFCRGRVFDTVEQDINQYNKNTEIFWASGACLFIRSKDFIDEGGFDQNFFAHMEEVDLCWRLKNKGKKIYFNSASVVYHVGGGTLNYNSAKKTFLNFRNSLFTIHKNDSRNVFLIIIIKLILDGIAGFRFILLGKPILCLSILKAHFHYYKAIPRLHKFRKKQSKHDIKTLIGFHNKAIVLSYFLLNKKTFTKIISD